MLNTEELKAWSGSLARVQVFGLLLDALQLPADSAIGLDPLAALLEDRQDA